MPLDKIQKDKIRKAFRNGSLKTKSVDTSTGKIVQRVCSQVHCHSSSSKNLIKIYLSHGDATFTMDHSIYVLDKKEFVLKPIPANRIKSRMEIATVCGDKIILKEVQSIEYLSPQEYTYDMGVPGINNFVLSNGILAHNSYSIGGISLDISKSDKYKGMKDQAEARFKDEGKEVKLQTLKIIKGLQQPRFGVGVRSAFGSALGRGVLSPRSFIGS